MLSFSQENRNLLHYRNYFVDAVISPEEIRGVARLLTESRSY
jgi:hypothetical protein